MMLGNNHSALNTLLKFVKLLSLTAMPEGTPLPCQQTEKQLA